MVNVFNTVKTLRLAKAIGAKKYFCVSTDKAKKSCQYDGCEQRIMEMFLMRESLTQEISMARLQTLHFLMVLLHVSTKDTTKNNPFQSAK